MRLGGAPKNGWTPLHQAALRGHTEVIKALAKCIDNPNPQENGICTAIHLAKKIFDYNQYIKVSITLLSCTDNTKLASECCMICKLPTLR